MVDLREAKFTIARVFKFEHWMRFYFIQEIDEKLWLVFSGDQLSKLEQKYAPLHELALGLKDKALDPNVCQLAISSFIRDHYDGIKYELGIVPKILDSKDFNAELYLFNIWTELHEQQLEEGIWDFEQWEQEFQTWRDSEKGKQVLMSMSTATSDRIN